MVRKFSLSFDQNQKRKPIQKWFRPFGNIIYNQSDNDIYGTQSNGTTYRIFNGIVIES